MGHHINKNGFWQSDKYPELKENQIILNFKDVHAQVALEQYAMLTSDRELSEDIRQVIENVNKAGLTKQPD